MICVKMNASWFDWFDVGGMKRKAVLIGVSGRVGQALMRELAALYDTLIVITRTQPRHISENMHIYHVQNFDALAKTVATMPIGADTDAFSCLELPKKAAASDDEFYQVNVSFNLAFAKACQDKGVNRFFYLSTANKKGGKQADWQVKSEVEAALRAMQFSDVAVFRLQNLMPAKEVFSLKNAGRFGLNFAKNALTQMVSFDKQERLTPSRVAIAMSLTAYRLHLPSKYKSNEHRFLIISHEQMQAMTELDG